MTELHDLPETSAAQATPPKGRLVTDLNTRVLHAALAVSFALAYLTAESEWWRLWHVAAGYVFAGAAAMRLLYGLLGPRHAQATLWWRRVHNAWQWVRAWAQPQSWSWAHASKGLLLLVYASVAALLLAVLPVTLSGLIVQEDWGSYGVVDLMAELHEATGEAMLAVVLTHVGAVLLQGWLKRSPYWQRMFSGRLPERGPDVRGSWQAVWLALSSALLCMFAWLVGSGAWAL